MNTKKNLGKSHLIKPNSSRSQGWSLNWSAWFRSRDRGRKKFEYNDLLEAFRDWREKQRITVHRDSYTKITCSPLPSLSCDDAKYIDFLQTTKFFSKCYVRCIRITVFGVARGNSLSLNFKFLIQHKCRERKYD